MGAYEHRKEAYLSAVKEFARNISKNTIADIGCGSEVFGIALAEGNLVVALDIDRKLLATIKRVVAPVNADAHYLPFRLESFNVVLSLSLMEHLKDPVGHVEDLRKIVKRGGWFILQLPNLQYFIEPHSKIPLLFLLPKRFQRIVFGKLEYAYVNTDLTIKCALKLLFTKGFVLRKVMKIYHAGVMRIMPWAPAYMFLLQKIA
ncbi:MAG: class I SAM-dependent methyltransferase [Thermoproteota archaeon]|nr:class I SAM-dependent methyltransferase [Candidatus Brockarchaeota archaeon]